MVFNATFNNISVISCRSVLLVEETGKTHLPAISHWQTLSHNVVSSTPRHERDSNSQRWWWYALIASAVVNPTTIRSWKSLSVTDRWFCPGPSVYSANKTDRHDIAEIFLKVALNTIKPKPHDHDHDDPSKPWIIFQHNRIFLFLLLHH